MSSVHNQRGYFARVILDAKRALPELGGSGFEMETHVFGQAFAEQQDFARVDKGDVSKPSGAPNSPNSAPLANALAEFRKSSDMPDPVDTSGQPEVLKQEIRFVDKQSGSVKNPTAENMPLLESPPSFSRPTDIEGGELPKSSVELHRQNLQHLPLQIRQRSPGLDASVVQKPPLEDELESRMRNLPDAEISKREADAVKPSSMRPQGQRDYSGVAKELRREFKAQTVERADAAKTPTGQKNNSPKLVIGQVILRVEAAETVVSRGNLVAEGRVPKDLTEASVGFDSRQFLRTL
jgi:hypothetical protein